MLGILDKHHKSRFFLFGAALPKRNAAPPDAATFHTNRKRAMGGGRREWRVCMEILNVKLRLRWKRLHFCFVLLGCLWRSATPQTLSGQRAVTPQTRSGRRPQRCVAGRVAVSAGGPRHGRCKGTSTCGMLTWFGRGTRTTFSVWNKASPVFWLRSRAPLPNGNTAKSVATNPKQAMGVAMRGGIAASAGGRGMGVRA
jgi:hypothetical protein